MASQLPISANDILVAVNRAVRGEPAAKLWFDTPQPALYNFRPSDLLATQAGRDKIAAMLKELGLM